MRAVNFLAPFLYLYSKQKLFKMCRSGHNYIIYTRLCMYAHTDYTVQILVLCTCIYICICVHVHCMCMSMYGHLIMVIRACIVLMFTYLLPIYIWRISQTAIIISSSSCACICALCILLMLYVCGTIIILAILSNN